eukprot:gnl/Chilomastix_caulleri/4947.p1 GENE.gnl/Chilomastix_caulleri/4947~~gnl/Chilomastix_caulleri/4947.p1  ORF type:complete len:67 (+),score=8.96 gnl/Chilomastix_caulleri/4947:35-235(+)
MTDYTRSFPLHRREPSPKHVQDSIVIHAQINELKARESTPQAFQIILTAEEFEELQQIKQEMKGST